MEFFLLVVVLCAAQGMLSMELPGRRRRGRAKRRLMGGGKEDMQTVSVRGGQVGAVSCHKLTL